MLESTRAREEAVRKETIERLDLFRRQREQAHQEETTTEDGNTDEPGAQEGQWTSSAARKRKKGTDKAGLKGLKVRRTSSAASRTDARHDTAPEDTPKTSTEQPAKPADTTKGPATTEKHAVLNLAENESSTISRSEAVKVPQKNLGLAAYSDSDED